MLTKNPSNESYEIPQGFLVLLSAVLIPRGLLWGSHGRLDRSQSPCIMRMASCEWQKKRIMRITLEIAVPMHPENHFGNGLQISNRFGGLGLAWSPPGVGPPIELKVAISNLLQVRYFHFKPADVVFSSRLM